jgi:FG-GAP-like repeat
VKCNAMNRGGRFLAILCSAVNKAKLTNTAGQEYKRSFIMWPRERFLITGMLLGLLLNCSINTFAVDFASLVNYPVGSAPTSVIVADFNGDGKLDLAIANSGSGTVSILLANESGSFHRAIDFDAGMAQPASLGMGDFNGDGKLDLVVFQLSPNAFGSLSPAAINILFGNGDGSFQAPKTTTLAVAIDLAVADFNLDRKADIAITDYDQDSSSTTIFILLGNGDGSFQSPRQSGMFPGGSGFLAAADFNNDAKPDLAIGVSSEARILLGQGDGTFQTAAAVPLTDGFLVQAIHAGDVNADGKLDLVVASLHFQGPPPGNNEGPSSRSDHIGILLGNGDGTLQAEQIAASSSWSKSSVFSPPSAIVSSSHFWVITTRIKSWISPCLEPPFLIPLERSRLRLSQEKETEHSYRL